MGKYSSRQQNQQSCRKISKDTYAIRYLTNKVIHSNGKITYTVVWDNGAQTSDVNSDDISKQPKDNYEIIKTHNNNLYLQKNIYIY